jgi:two-component system, NarL family, nitrate/nitrite response regulator NarL
LLVTDKIRIAVVDPYPIFREGVVQALRRDKQCLVVGEGATAKDAERAAANELDVLLIEAAVPNSLQAVKSILETHGSVKVIFLASVEHDLHATRALRDGAHGYVMKGISATELIRAVVAVHAGERYITSELACRLITKPETRRAGELQLSFRERQVMDHMSKGLTNKEIADLLGLTVSTIKHYKSLAFKKLGVRNRLEATIFADNQVSRVKS